ncbi:DUF1521 domain-containing protein [Piscinibacter sp.]|uniref:DUF1521 domain-containing protein n=1 Tax=Piscinibacter sp. TaxID=1903157 RepID=UPI002C73E326|nr:DUF1521 domain-containing protein [Albitalea sp.]HUG22620.1 DUF1521 domain-containing protein [Albitalea sp.]
MNTTASATVTASASLTIGGCLQPSVSNPTNASTSMVGGKVCFENDNYRITMGDDNTVTINNKNTGETYQAWGDPHMKIDGKQAFDFWGTTTFNLDDGTKVTIETTPWANNPDMTLSSKVTITNGDYGVQVTGVDTNQVGDLKFHETQSYGRLLDAVVADGNRLHENPTGKGFLGVDAEGRVRAVDQQYINETDLKKGGAQAEADGQRLADAFKDAFRLLTGLVAITFAGSFLRALSNREQAPGGPTRPQLPREMPDMWAGGSRRGLELEMGRHGGWHGPRANVDIDVSVNLTLTRSAFLLAGRA